MANSKYQTALEHINFTRAKAEARIVLTEKRKISALVIRVDTNDKKTTSACSKAGYPLPSTLKAEGRISDCLKIWISPDEFLFLFSNAAKQQKAEEKLTKALHKKHHALIDASGTYTYLLLSGEERITLLRKLCAYDLQNSFPVGKAVSTLTAKAPAILIHLNNKQILILVRNSFADYAYKTLSHAAVEFV